MATITLSAQERETLCDILTSYLSDLRMEIVDTEKKELRDTLKEEELLIKSLLGRLATE